MRGAYSLLEKRVQTVFETSLLTPPSPLKGGNLTKGDFVPSSANTNTQVILKKGDLHEDTPNALYFDGARFLSDLCKLLTKKRAMLFFLLHQKGKLSFSFWISFFQNNGVHPVSSNHNVPTRITQQKMPGKSFIDFP